MNLLPITKEFYTPIKADFVKIANEKKFREEIIYAIQILKGNEFMQKCDGQSILDAVLNISQTSLTLNPILNEAYLVPHKGKCVLYPSYQGLCKLATETGHIKSIECQLIYEGDDVVIDLATTERIKKHTPYILTGKPKGRVLGGYSIATIDDGHKHIEIMSEAQIHDVRKYSESFKRDGIKKTSYSPWNNFADEMYRKTIVKRHFKYLPKATVSEAMQKAIELDNKDYDFPATFEQGSYIESLLLSSSIPEKTEREIFRALHASEFTQSKAADCIEYLKDNQTDAIDAGGNYSQTDIQKKLQSLKDID